jgi:hypothetical protein
MLSIAAIVEEYLQMKKDFNYIPLTAADFPLHYTTNLFEYSSKASTAMHESTSRQLIIPHYQSVVTAKISAK